MTLAAVQAAKKRHQQSLETLHAGTITIAGASYAAAVILGRVQHRMDGTSGLWRQVQPLTVTVLKTRLATAPAKKSVITFGAFDYQVDEVAGHNAQDVFWTLKAERKLPSPS